MSPCWLQQRAPSSHRSWSLQLPYHGRLSSTCCLDRYLIDFDLLVRARSTRAAAGSVPLTTRRPFLNTSNSACREAMSAGSMRDRIDIVPEGGIGLGVGLFQECRRLRHQRFSRRRPCWLCRRHRRRRASRQSTFGRVHRDWPSSRRCSDQADPQNRAAPSLLGDLLPFDEKRTRCAATWRPATAPASTVRKRRRIDLLLDEELREPRIVARHLLVVRRFASRNCFSRMAAADRRRRAARRGRSDLLAFSVRTIRRDRRVRRGRRSRDRRPASRARC